MLISEHMVVTKRILRYIWGNISLGIKFVRDSSLSINIGLEISLVAFRDGNELDSARLTHLTSLKSGSARLVSRAGSPSQ
jgi:hypothetical protein